MSLPNLFPALDSGTVNGVTCTREGDSYTVDGTPTAWGGIYKKTTLPAGYYRLTQSGADKPSARCILPDATQYSATSGFTLTEPMECILQLTLNPSETYTNATVTPYLRRIS
ncbi:hypothetical protein BLI708_00445 [Bifidobacterium imperatoris]|uniref:Uncharacterized protein n=1 Tax=Bifidobacterium imperatoris TaxID=2020965 RepID=A0A2N5IP82_9BIFI|nr:hypothetical protein [Bifidobacterium imperatoris]PLS23758.1 hypothetical protein Tam1G_2189 [Bifidobacterium imperatoris]QSY57797.1 hypothetical protein BLI708_00150 [Bifidobacterium imperatoris]QSY57846.1 hypothetical protein BLI708_00445 [Bifidobacterium imperatoris]